MREHIREMLLRLEAAKLRHIHDRMISIGLSARRPGIHAE
jgi:hypothetical protein